jgi:hypothetical protein
VAQFFLIDGTDIGVERVRLGSQAGYVSLAERGTVSTSAIVVDDPAASLTLTGWKSVAVLESACSHPSIFRGFMATRSVGRGDDDSLILSASRRWDADIVDLNAKLYLRAIHLKEGKRPRETDLARRDWIINSQWFPSDIEAGTYISNAEPATLDEADYRGQYAADVLNDCVAARFGKNYFVHWDEALGASLFYGPTDATTLTSTLRISNVEADRDDITTFAPWRDAKLSRDPSGVYSGVYLQYANGSILRTSASTIAAFLRRDITVRNDRIGLASTAESIAAQLLTKYSAEEDRITCTVRLPAAKVNLVRAGMRIECKFSHLPGYTSFTFMRVVLCRVKQTFASDQVYDVDLEMVPTQRASTGGGVGTPPGGGGGSGPGPFLPPADTPPGVVQAEFISNRVPAMELPLATTPGNLLVSILTDRNSASIVPPTGFTEIKSVSMGGLRSLVMSYRVVQAGDGTGPWNGPGHHYMYELSSASFDSFVSIQNAAASLTQNAGGSLTPTAGRPAIIIGAGIAMTSDVGPGEPTVTPAAGVTEKLDTAAMGGIFAQSPRLWIGQREVNPTSGAYLISGTMAQSVDASGITAAFVSSSADDFAPSPGQETCEQVTGDGIRDTFALNHPYLDLSVKATLQGTVPIGVTETDPAHGVVQTDFIPASGRIVQFRYQAGAGPATGSNNPACATFTAIPPEALGSGATGSGLLALTDAGTWDSFRFARMGGLELTSVGSNSVLDLAGANVFDLTLRADQTISFANVPTYSGRESDVTLLLRQSGTGPWGVTWPGSVSWVGGSAPSIAQGSNAVTLVGLLTLDGGTSWLGTSAGQSASTLQNHGNTGSAETFSYAIAETHSATVDASTTFSLTGATSGVPAYMVLELTVGSSPPYTITWPGTVVWQDTAPTLPTTAGDVMFIELYTRDGGTTWYGFPIGGGGASADDTRVWMPLTTVVGGVPDLVWDTDGTNYSLIPSLVPLSGDSP